MKARFAVAVLATLATAALVASSAGAAVTMGSDLSQAPDDGVFCATTCTWVQSPLPGRVSAAPTDGVIVRWRIRTDAVGGPFALQVARPAGGNDRTGIATSASVTTPGAGTHVFPTRLAVKAGDNIGIRFDSTNLARFHGGPGVVGAAALYFPPALADGTTRTPTIVNTNLEFFVNADLETDLDGDGFGDETQDQCVGRAGATDGCDRVAPKVTVGAKSLLSYRKLSAKVTTDKAATLTTTGRVTVKVGKRRKTIRVNKLITPLAAGETKTMKLSFARKARGQVKKLMLAKRKLTLVAEFRAVDDSGNVAVVTRKIRLKL